MAAKKSAKKSAKKAATTAKRKSPDSAAASRKRAKAETGIRASEVNMGHIFALRPRATTSFPQQALHDAKQALADESYSTLADAARAVADRALEIPHDGARPRRGRNTPHF